MTRDVDASVTSASNYPTLRYRPLVDLYLDSGTLHLTTGRAAVQVGTITYTPVGGFGGMEAIQEESDVFPRGVRLWLSAVGSVNLAEPLAEDMFNRRVKIFRSFLNEFYSLTGTAQLIFDGRINDGTLKMGDKDRGNYFELECESRLRREARSAYYTLEDHQLTNSGDTFFIHVTKIPNYKGVWGDEASVRLSGGTGDPYRGFGGGGGNGDRPRVQPH